MSNNNSLIEALKYLGQSGKEYGLSLAINQANEQAKQIKATVQDDMERRVQLTNLADDIAVRMAGAGAQGNHIAAIAQAMRPQQASTAEQAVIMGAQMGDESLMKIGQDAINEEAERKLAHADHLAANELEKQKRLFSHQSALADKNNASQEERAEKRALKQPKLLPGGEIGKITNLDTSALALEEILAELEGDPKIGNWIGPAAAKIPSMARSADAARFISKVGRQTSEYINKVTGAGVGVVERKLLTADFVNIADRPDQMAAKLRGLLKEGEQVRSIVLKNFKAGGYHVGELERLTPSAHFTPSPGQALPSDDPMRRAIMKYTRPIKK